jgi:hypothetical protein
LFPKIQPNDLIKLDYQKYEVGQFTVVQRPDKIADGLLISEVPRHEDPLVIKAENNEITILHKGSFIDGTAREIVVSNEKEEQLVLLCGFETIAIQPIEKECVNVIFNENETIIYFKQPLPEGIVSGQIAVNKWKAILADHMLDAKGHAYNKEYKIYCNLTQHFMFPLMQRGALSEEFINRFIIQVDEELHKLKEALIKNEHNL